MPGVKQKTNKGPPGFRHTALAPFIPIQICFDRL